MPAHTEFNLGTFLMGFPGGAVVKNLSANAGDSRNMGSIPGWGRSPGVGNDNPLQYSCPKNSMGLQRVGHDCCVNKILRREE